MLGSKRVAWIGSRRQNSIKARMQQIELKQAKTHISAPHTDTHGAWRGVPGKPSQLKHLKRSFHHWLLSGLSPITHSVSGPRQFYRHRSWQ
jgi:hypothetical protein